MNLSPLSSWSYISSPLVMGILCISMGQPGSEAIRISADTTCKQKFLLQKITLLDFKFTIPIKECRLQLFVKVLKIVQIVHSYVRVVMKSVSAFWSGFVVIKLVQLIFVDI